MPQGAVGKKRQPWGVWGLTIITLGVYYYVWWYKVNRETRDFDNSINVNPALSVLAWIPGSYLVIPPFVSAYRTGKRIAQVQAAAGLPATCSGGLGILLAILFSTHTVYYQGQLNKVWDSYPGAGEGTVVPHRGVGAAQGQRVA
ncbi:hypothetical protein ABH926_002707 [Catenulispora sp. GP43]|uniref:DUF4234 domain-containing protein n=1 Tax=Catenulispora sp. GP43 TaxID=3156263 RepID=UPI003511547A